MDEDSFFDRLQELEEEAYQESDDIRTLVKELVPTYSYSGPAAAVTEEASETKSLPGRYPPAENCPERSLPEPAAKAASEATARFRVGNKDGSEGGGSFRPDGFGDGIFRGDGSGCGDGIVCRRRSL